MNGIKKKSTQPNDPIFFQVTQEVLSLIQRLHRHPHHRYFLSYEASNPRQIDLFLEFPITDTQICVHTSRTDDVTVSEAFVRCSWYNFFYYCPKGYYCYSSGHKGHSSKGISRPLQQCIPILVANFFLTETDFKFLTYRNSKTKLPFIPRDQYGTVHPLFSAVRCTGTWASFALNSGSQLTPRTQNLYEALHRTRAVQHIVLRYIHSYSTSQLPLLATQQSRTLPINIGDACYDITTQGAADTGTTVPSALREK